VDNPLWLAPEVIKGQESSEKADVYSYSIVLWVTSFSFFFSFFLFVPLSYILLQEIGSNKAPFGEYEFSFFSQLEDRIVKEKLRPTIPTAGWPEGYVSLIRRCWDDNPYSRPSFFTIVEAIETLVSEHKS